MIRSIGFNFHRLLGEIDGNSKQQIRYSKDKRQQRQIVNPAVLPNQSVAWRVPRLQQKRQQPPQQKHRQNPSKSCWLKNEQPADAKTGGKTTPSARHQAQLRAHPLHTNALQLANLLQKQLTSRTARKPAGTKAIARASEIELDERQQVVHGQMQGVSDMMKHAVANSTAKTKAVAHNAVKSIVDTWSV